MATLLGGCGPGWYMEGIAELLGMHAWDPDAGRLRLGVMPPDGPDARSVGRVGLLQEAVAEKQALSIPAVMKIDNNRILPNRSYAWVGALATLLDQHPRYQQRFRKLSQHVLDPDFNNRVRQTYADDWADLSIEWRLFITTLQYGHDIPREAINFQRGERLASTARSSLTIKANQGWQSTKVLLEANQQYQLTAEGKFTIAVEPGDGPEGQPVESTAGGITLDYHNGRPLGVLLAAIDPRDAPATEPRKPLNAPGGFFAPVPLGAASTFRAPYSGTLYLRVNDSPAKLSDNSGELKVTLKPRQ